MNWIFDRVSLNCWESVRFPKVIWKNDSRCTSYKWALECKYRVRVSAKGNIKLGEKLSENFSLWRFWLLWICRIKVTLPSLPWSLVLAILWKTLITSDLNSLANLLWLWFFHMLIILFSSLSIWEENSFSVVKSFSLHMSSYDRYIQMTSFYMILLSFSSKYSV